MTRLVFNNYQYAILYYAFLYQVIKYLALYLLQKDFQISLLVQLLIGFYLFLSFCLHSDAIKARSFVILYKEMKESPIIFVIFTLRWFILYTLYTKYLEYEIS